MVAELRAHSVSTNRLDGCSVRQNRGCGHVHRDEWDSSGGTDSRSSVDMADATNNCVSTGIGAAVACKGQSTMQGLDHL